MARLVPFLVGLALAVALYIGVGAAMGPAACRDGWRSPSIGIQGACSSHGGVDPSPGIFRWVASLAGGAFVWYAVDWFFFRRPHARREEESPEALPTVPAAPPLPTDLRPETTAPNRFWVGSVGQATVHCPKCNSLMDRTPDRFGKEFYLCSTRPNCDGVLPVT